MVLFSSRLLLFACFSLAVLVLTSSNVRAEAQTLLWTYKIEQSVFSLNVSSDGNYVAAGDGLSVLFLSKSGNLLWRHLIGYPIWEVSISSDGNYVAAVGQTREVYFFGPTAPPVSEFPIGLAMEASLPVAIIYTLWNRRHLRKTFGKYA